VGVSVVTCVKIQPGDITGIKSTTTGRISGMDTTKYGGYERNGSMMQTCIETLDDQTISSSTAMMPHRTLQTHRLREDAL